MPVGKVAQELDFHPNLLHLWRRRMLTEGDKAFVGRGRVKPENTEIRQLRKALEKVKEERDILKKLWPHSPSQANDVWLHCRAPRDVQGRGDV
jgi:transposase-like protein